jgi:poly(beta-D-mannuronate) lyase
VTIAEVAAVQGYDLYALSADGRSLHQAIEFLARGLADPTLVVPYAAANERPGFANYLVQDRSFLQHRGHGRHYMAWLETYRARFPERPATTALVRLLDEAGAARRPLIDEFSGGNTTCLFALPD